MNITIKQFRKHSLSLALIAGLGLSSGAMMAQDAAEYPAAEAKAQAAAEYATRLEALAREAAREAQEAAQIAARIRDGQGASPRGQQAAKAMAHQAHESSVAAQQAKNKAIEAAEDARAGRTVAEDSVVPRDGVVKARENARQTEQATREALESANRAKAAAVGTAIATMPDPASSHGQTMTPEQHRAEHERQRMAQQRMMNEQRTAGGQQMQRGGKTDSQNDTMEEATERVLLERENRPDVLVTSSPDMNPDVDVSGDSSVNFGDIDENGDGYVSRQEAQSNPNLSDEFNTVDSNRDGRLSRNELQGWGR